MLRMIESVSQGPWFRDPSPFRGSIQQGHTKLCVITGPNASGKSLVRKVLQAHYQREGVEFIHVSQERRSSATGLERLMVYGDESDESTGRNSVRTLLKAFQTGQGRSSPFALMLDEPEIGCSEETQAAIGDRIAGEIRSMPQLRGLYVITHSRVLVGQLLKSTMPTHWRLAEDALTLRGWVHRSIGVHFGPELEELVELGRERWSAVQGLINQRKKGVP